MTSVAMVPSARGTVTAIRDLEVHMSARRSATNSLCIFVKEPTPGTAKTRLAKSIGAAAAAILAAAFIEDTLALAAQFENIRVTIALSGSSAHLPQVASLFPTIAQGEGDLGKRLERGLRHCLIETAGAVVIGTDSPGLPSKALHDAFDLLTAETAVIGPAADGGFYLLGVTRCPEGMLDGVPWSTSETLACTVDRLAAAGTSVSKLMPWFDVDTAEDLEYLRKLLIAGAIHAPATARALRL